MCSEEQTWLAQKATGCFGRRPAGRRWVVDRRILGLSGFLLGTANTSRYELLTGRLRIRPSTFELTGTQRHAAARPVERGVMFPMPPLEQGKLPGWRGALHPGRQLEFCQFFGPGQ